ncbi:hypothetical protein PUN28_020408 [Cardiocondyla obscurior]|uniref:Uncharacterized protein n=1 Tax=Cardiocondyla obscurior TaxID=286306 RepID=A0AAW2E9K5_9HYME
MHASSRSGRTVALRQNLASRLLRELWFSFEIFRASCRHSAKCAPSSRRSFRGRIAKELVSSLRRLVHNTVHASSRSGRTVALRRMYNRARRSTAVRTKVSSLRRLVHNTMHASSRSGRTVALRRMYNRARRSTAVRTKVSFAREILKCFALR